MMARKNLKFAMPPTSFGESGAKRSQDDKPYRVLVEPVRAASVDNALWSHLSLRSRLGMGLSQAWPQLSRLVPAPLIPARPFGLGLRFDEAHLVARDALRHRSTARRIKPTPRSASRVAQDLAAHKPVGAHP